MVDDERWMRRALIHAARGLGRTTPNPVVGACIVTRDGVVVGDGAHERAGGPHAEVHALQEAGSRAHGATLYCTLEPCVHRGYRRTGPCTEQIIAAGVSRVVAAIEDPNPRVRGQGVATLRAHGIEVLMGVAAAEAERLNRAYLMSVRHGRPWVILKTAMSADGCVTAARGARTAITGAASFRHAQMVRAQVDAVAVGSGTVLVDDPILTVREVYRARPITRVVFDRRLRLPPSAAILQARAAGPVILLTAASAANQHADRVRALEHAGAKVVTLETGSVREALEALSGLEVQSLLVEGGPTLHRALFAAQLVDELNLYVASMVAGRDGVRWYAPANTVAMDSLRARALGRDVLVEGYVHRTH